jgi:signal peptidase II
MTLLLAAVLVALDQFSKAWVVRNLPIDGSEIPLVLGFGITHTRNGGAAFGMLRNLEVHIGAFVLDGTLLLGLLSAAVSLGLIVFVVREGARLSAFTRVALALVLAGAAGNMIDRLRLRYVVDFVHFQVGRFDFPVFNVADASIVIGAILLVLGSLLADGTNARAARKTYGPAPRGHVLDEVPELPPLGGRPPSDPSA